MTQNEIDGLVTILKQVVSSMSFTMPSFTIQDKRQIDLKSLFSKETFVVDVNHPSSINQEKFTIQLRWRKEVVLLRVDYGAAPHGNPDGTKVICPHLHILREGESRASWAIPLPEVFSSPEHFVTTLKDFLQYCNTDKVEQLKIIQQEELRQEDGTAISEFY